MIDMTLVKQHRLTKKRSRVEKTSGFLKLIPSSSSFLKGIKINKNIGNSNFWQKLIKTTKHFLKQH